jgi:Acyl-CoA dehydrogenase, C-terminal domain
MAKLLASEASWQAANACLDTHGGYGFAAEYDIEHKFRETRLHSVAPISSNLILAYLGQHVLGMPAFLLTGSSSWQCRKGRLRRHARAWSFRHRRNVASARSRRAVLALAIGPQPAGPQGVGRTRVSWPRSARGSVRTLPPTSSTVLPSRVRTCAASQSFPATAAEVTT